MRHGFVVIESAAESGEYVVGVGRFGQIILGTEPNRFDRRGDAAVSREDEDSRERVGVPEIANELETRAARHPQVDDRELGRFGSRKRDRGVVAVGSPHIVASIPKGSRQPFDEDLNVVDQQNRRPRIGYFS